MAVEKRFMMLLIFYVTCFSVLVVPDMRVIVFTSTFHVYFHQAKNKCEAKMIQTNYFEFTF